MPALSELHKDLYNGVKKEWKQSPWTVSALIVLWGACWAVYFYVYPGLAQAADVKDVQQEVHATTIKNLDREIISILTQRCKAASKGFLTVRLQDLLQEYQSVSGKPYPQPLPSCEDLN